MRIGSDSETGSEAELQSVVQLGPSRRNPLRSRRPVVFPNSASESESENGVESGGKEVEKRTVNRVEQYLTNWKPSRKYPDPT